MSLLAATARRRITGGPPITGPEFTVDGAPSTAPYNVPSPINTPTPDDTGQAVHPAVVDFWRYGLTSWNGYRFWAVWTPYAGSAIALENPCIYASNDGVNWTEPAGMSNPVAGKPPVGFNSDPDLEYDPATGILWLMWRAVIGTGQSIRLAHTQNGTDWTIVGEVWATAGEETALSPCLVRVGPSDWRTFEANRTAATITMRTATTPLGPWSAATPASSLPTASGGVWHFDVQTHGTALLMLLSRRQPWNTYAYTSTDGLTWQLNSAPLLIPGGSSAWDTSPYRATMQLGEDQQHFRVWYSALSNGGSWRIGLTKIPLTEWPAPPTP